MSVIGSLPDLHLALLEFADDLLVAGGVQLVAVWVGAGLQIDRFFSSSMITSYSGSTSILLLSTSHARYR